jgi:hypothetical protein
MKALKTAGKILDVVVIFLWVMIGAVVAVHIVMFFGKTFFLNSSWAPLTWPAAIWTLIRWWKPFENWCKSLPHVRDEEEKEELWWEAHRFPFGPSLKESEDKPPEDKRKSQQERMEDRAKYAAMLRAIPKDVYKNMPPTISIPTSVLKYSPRLPADEEKP